MSRASLSGALNNFMKLSLSKTLEFERKENITKYIYIGMRGSIIISDFI